MGIKNVCASTQRAINLIKDMFVPPDKLTKDLGTATLINLASFTEAISLM